MIHENGVIFDRLAACQKKENEIDSKFFFSKSSESKTVSESAEINIVDQPTEPVPGPSSKENPQAPDQDKNSFADTKDSKRVMRKFQNSWLRDYSWLNYDPEGNYMTCKLFIQHKKSNVFTQKTVNFKTTTVVRYAESKDHKDAVQAENLSTHYVKAVTKVLNYQESSIVVALMAAFRIAKK